MDCLATHQEVMNLLANCVRLDKEATGLREQLAAEKAARETAERERDEARADNAAMLLLLKEVHNEPVCLPGTRPGQPLLDELTRLRKHYDECPFDKPFDPEAEAIRKKTEAFYAEEEEPPKPELRADWKEVCARCSHGFAGTCGYDSHYDCDRLLAVPPAEEPAP